MIVAEKMNELMRRIDRKAMFHEIDETWRVVNWTLGFGALPSVMLEMEHTTDETRMHRTVRPENIDSFLEKLTL
tara:strand:+ start:690 stop:911 length:222 start_codon:yes stop_codon:yes gene_type:complete